VQVYRGFDIGSGKETTPRAPHHLVSIKDPMDAIDAARFAELADAAIADVRARGKLPIVTGGTFLWVKALLQGLVAAPPASEEVRARHRAVTVAEGRAALHAKLSEVDPEAAARLHPNDVVRVSRALEVFELLGERMSEMQAEHAFKTPRYDAALFAVERTPEDLTLRIERRAREWLDHGWIEETEALVRTGFGDARAMGSVGYREVAAYLRGEIERPLLLDSIVRSTRVFARRQRTWLNHEPVTWVSP
jgi:tRNA dimethylallyltransferase